MIRPYTGYILAEEVDNTKKVGGFIIDSDSKKVCKAKVLKTPLNQKISASGFCQTIDFTVGDVILYNAQGVVYEDITETNKTMLIDIDAIVGVEENE